MATSPELARALRIPYAEPGLAIGLFGGSFNPPHAGHVNAAELALRRGGLDRIWWMVTPGNPLKSGDRLPDLERRIALSRAIVTDPRIEVTAFEASLGTRYTQHTVAALLRRRPRLRFVWVMGADGLAEFHRWRNWRRIADALPMIVIDRPGSTLAVRSAPAATALARYRIRESAAPAIARMRPPAWVFLHGPRSQLSSTAIRADRTIGAAAPS